MAVRRNRAANSACGFERRKVSSTSLVAAGRRGHGARSSGASSSAWTLGLGARPRCLGGEAGLAHELPYDGGGCRALSKIDGCVFAESNVRPSSVRPSASSVCLCVLCVYLSWHRVPPRGCANVYICIYLNMHHALCEPYQYLLSLLWGFPLLLYSSFTLFYSSLAYCLCIYSCYLLAAGLPCSASRFALCVWAWRAGRDVLRRCATALFVVVVLYCRLLTVCCLLAPPRK